MRKFLNLPLLLILGLVCLVTWVTWQRLVTDALSALDMGWEDSLHALSTGAYACLLIGSLGLRRAYHLLQKRPLQPLSIRMSILLGFILPFLVSLIPYWVENLPFNPELFRLGDVFRSLQTWLPALQVFSLGCLLLLGERFSPANFHLGGVKLSWWAVGLAGLGLWLVSIFSYQLISLLAPADSARESLATPVRIWLSAALVLALPLLEGLFFRGRLLPQLRDQLGPIAGILACAAISALLTLQPILWVPAFLANCGFNFLTTQTGGLRSSIYAQAVFDALALLVLPGVIL